MQKLRTILMEKDNGQSTCEGGIPSANAYDYSDKK
jgi:hypothetical protein